MNDEHPDVFKLKVLDVTDTATTLQHLEAWTAELGSLDLSVISSGIGEICESSQPATDSFDSTMTYEFFLYLIQI